MQNEPKPRTTRVPRARRRDPSRVDPHVGTRVEAFVKDAELGAVAAVLSAARDEILSRWLEAARLQSFHTAHPDQAVADHVPHLFDALLAFLQRAAPRAADATAPLDDPAVHEAARAHARVRFAQGLGAADVLTEFRLLRQEIGRALRERTAGSDDVMAAELLVHDALDGATALALAALDAQEADRRRLAADVVRLGAEKDAALDELRVRASMIEAAHDAIFGWDAGGGITLWNRGAEELYGFDAREALGRTSHDLLRTPGEQVATLLDALARDGRWDGELTHTARDGRRLVVEARIVLVGGAGGGYVLETTRDLTARRAAEAEREQLLAVLAHDLKTPLTAIKGNADLLRRQVARGRADPERVDSHAAAIAAAAAAMDAQIGELLDAARVRAGQPLELVRRPTDLVALAQQVAARAQSTAPGHRIAVETDAPELVGSWDAVRLERVLGNLLSNAVKYSPGGGEVRIEVSGEERGGAPWARLTVSDRGIGVPAADLPHVFDPYRRGANVGAVEGEGLGLAGAKQIVEQHGGTIAVEGREGGGSTVTVRLPLAG